MKKFLLFLSALFLSVSFANAQETYEINSGTGVLNNGTSKSSVWTANDCPAGLKITATDSNGNAVNAISYWSPTYKFYAAGLFDGTSNSSSSPTTYTISVNDGYLITGYKLEYKASSRNAVTLSNEYEYINAPSNTSMYDMTEKDLNTRTTTFTVLSSDAARASSNSVNVVSFTVTVQAVGEGGEEPGDDSAIMEQYDAIAKPTFGKTGNTTYINSAKVGDIVVEDIPEVLGDDIEKVGRQSGVTKAIEVAAGAEFDLNITYKLNWGDLAIYQIDNDGATKEYGYYFGSWEPNGSTAKVAQNIAEDGISVTEVVDEVCTATFPISISENHNPGDIVVVRAITGVKSETNNSAFEQNISEGGYVDFLFVVTEAVEESWSSFYAAMDTQIPAGVEAYIVTTANKEYVTLTQIFGTIPAMTGVIFKSNPKSNTGSEELANVEGNLLEGVLMNTNKTEEAYVLGCVDGEYGFYKAAMNQLDGTAWLANAGKAYLPVSALPASAQGAASFSFRFGEGTTGVEEVKTENGNVKAIYDLTGRKLKGENGNLKGIYIINGKKVLVK